MIYIDYTLSLKQIKSQMSHSLCLRWPKGGCSVEISYKQLHEAVVFLNVSLEDLLTGTQHSLESCTIEFDAL